MQFQKLNLGMFIDVEKPITEISSNKFIVSGEDAKLTEILDLILRKKLRKIPVLDKSNHLKGIVTSIDTLDLLGGGDKHDIFKKNKENLQLKVENFMTKHLRTVHFKTTIRKTLDTFRIEGRGLYPVVDSRKLISVVSERDFVKRINMKTGIRVYEIMVEKPIFARKKYTVHEVAKMMCRGGFRRLPVIEDNILLGIVTPTDILFHLRKKRIEDKLVFDRTPIYEIMNKNVITTGDEEDLFSVAGVMRKANVGGLPVVEDDELVGMITERDILDVLV
jgi:predicted transcriptional regulator